MTWQSVSDVIKWLVPSGCNLSPSFVEGRLFFPLPNCLPYSSFKLPLFNCPRYPLPRDLFGNLCFWVFIRIGIWLAVRSLDCHAINQSISLQHQILCSLLHRPLFTKFFTPAEPLVFQPQNKPFSQLLPPFFSDFSLSFSPQLSHLPSNHKTNHFPNYYHHFLGRRGSRIGASLVLDDQLKWHIILTFRFRPILISIRGYGSRPDSLQLPKKSSEIG